MKWLRNLIVKIAAKKAAKMLKLKEGPMDASKKWWKSKGVLTGIVIVLTGTYEALRAQIAPQVGWNLPEIPGLVYTILGAFGIYARASATTEIKK